jgi:hypothetical protein
MTLVWSNSSSLFCGVEDKDTTCFDFNLARGISRPNPDQLHHDKRVRRTLKHRATGALRVRASSHASVSISNIRQPML